MLDQTKIPQHIAIIMDGNGRWATKRMLPKILGHRRGAEVVDVITETAREIGVSILTLYTFSTENWKRPKEEVEGLFKLLEEHLKTKEQKFLKNNVRFCVTGDIEPLPQSSKEMIRKVMESTKKNSALTLNLALNYGGRLEILQAAKRIAQDVKDARLAIDKIDEKTFSDYLYTKGMPDPDLMIRTSGEMRISNFLLWQLAYSEFYITEKLWPDFTSDDFIKAIEAYQKRDRRFGG